MKFRAESGKPKEENKKQAYLSYAGPGERIISGVGLFAKGIPPEPVRTSIANQYSTDEMKALGWIVEWKTTEDR